MRETLEATKLQDFKMRKHYEILLTNERGGGTYGNLWEIVEGPSK